MTTSMKEIACCIDPLYPPDSLKALGGRFRYQGVGPGALPAGGTSLRALAARVNGPGSKKLEFLHYNTYLMQATIPLASLFRVLGGGQGLLIRLELEPVKLLAWCLEWLGTSGFCDKYVPAGVEVCGVALNPAHDICEGLADAGALAGFLLELYGNVIDAVLDLIQMPFDVIIAGIAYLTDLPTDIPFKNSAEIDERAVEIGSRLSGYDLVALCEVWQQKHKDALLTSVRSHGACFSGPPNPVDTEYQQRIGSGLLVFSPQQLPIKAGEPAYHQYVKTGCSRELGSLQVGPAVDADHWSRKAVVLTLVEFEHGTLEVYSTHLYSGGDMPEAICKFFGGEPSESEKALVREVQIGELREFIRNTHQDNRVAIIVGDFNVGPVERHAWRIEGEKVLPAIPLADNHPGLCDQLCTIPPGPRFNDWLEFDDWYALPMFDKAYPPKYGDGNPTDPEDLGHTNRGGGAPTFDTYCPRKATRPADLVDGTKVTTDQPVGHLIDGDDYYCSEMWPPDSLAGATGNRIDYVFVQRPVPSHAFNLDVSRIRRRAFKRSGEGHKEPYLSDHLGLEVALFASPK